ncbi:hypothetical protein DER46DRAFT_256207 [Fusarium sp. MPI-SDFR-AT-0072]|nr:hypothetical protein DER46DRAFT_256207 [Fusarium sp. MPI-SDFR-AT-0072]
MWIDSVFVSSLCSLCLFCLPACPALPCLPLSEHPPFSHLHLLSNVRYLPLIPPLFVNQTKIARLLMVCLHNKQTAACAVRPPAIPSLPYPPLPLFFSSLNQPSIGQSQTPFLSLGRAWPLSNCAVMPLQSPKPYYCKRLSRFRPPTSQVHTI